ncbi:hypothetical protein K437DRAFT_118981 [Tilletiaria anomala UBC 951]|uniref:Uncharacterized protein n=1 Tax=Tilletiaria anomala (strain ATCC 24038 / CBS 436.72 / UBC 951) TaxID=1037660 RepID=A0A066VVK2_TILAU|nr:uncharacterized protein K437DRAFT_118981 [Tilletiaria anomala UBC 951]KDN45752.1 hypothetical protein K437DRAFT_118981 [Tilletiaria anomala UBC 951]
MTSGPLFRSPSPPSTRAGAGVGRREDGSSSSSEPPRLYGLTPSRANALINARIRHIGAELADPVGAFAPASSLNRSLAAAAAAAGREGGNGGDRVKALANERLQELKELSHIYGLNERQAHACVRMALGLSIKAALAAPADAGDDDDSARKGKARGMRADTLARTPAVPSIALGSSLLKLIVPRPGSEYGKELVLDILGALGPAPGALEDPRANGQKAGGSSGLPAQDAQEEGEEEEEAEEEPDGDMDASRHRDMKKKAGKPLRRHVHLRVQALALKLLILLLDIPAISIEHAASEHAAVSSLGSQAADPLDAARKAHCELPSSFLSVAAKRMLDRSYGVLFHFLEYQTLRPHLCYLLCKIARRKHVKNYRVAGLLALRSIFPDEPAISSLLAVFGNFYPDLLFPDLVGAARGSGSGGGTLGAGMNLGLLSGGGVPPPGLRYPDLAWLVHVVELHRHPLGLPQPQPSFPEQAGHDAQAAGESERLAKRRKLTAAKAGLLGAADSLVGSAPGNASGSGSYTIPSGAVISVDASSLIISELPSIRSLGMALDRLQMPSQMAAALNNRLIRLAVLVDDEVEMHDCIAEWLVSAFEDEMRSQKDLGPRSAPSSAAAGSPHVGLLVERTQELFALAGELPPALARWLYALLASGAAQMLKSKVHARRFFDSVPLEMVLPLVALLKPDAPEAISKNLLQPLESILRAPCAPFSCKIQILRSLTDMLQLWARFDWATGLRQSQNRALKIRYGITPMRHCEMCFESIDLTGAFLTRLAGNVLQSRPRSIKAQAAVLDAYATLSGPLSGLHSSVLPSMPATMLLILSPSIYCPSRFFSLTQALRRNFEVWEFAQDEVFEQQQQQPQSQEQQGSSQPGSVASGAPANSREGRLKMAETAYFDEANREDLNRMVVVLADLVWRVKGFATVEEENGISVGLGKRFFTNFKQRCEERGESALMTGSLTQGLAFVSLAEQYMFSLARERGWSGAPLRPPISQASLKAARTRHGFPASVAWTDYRATFLQWLDAKGAGGLQELLSAIMSSLRPPVRQQEQQGGGTPTASAGSLSQPVAGSSQFPQAL